MDNQQELEDFKTQREKLVKSIRKQNRQSQFNKRRNPTVEPCQFQSLEPHYIQKNPKVLVIDQERREAIEEFISRKYFPEMFSDLVKLLYSDDILDRHQAIIGIRKILSLNQSPPISLVFDHNILPIIIEYMKQDIYPHLRLEATWCVSNIGTGSSEDVLALVENGVLPLLIQFLSENQLGVADQAIWAIGNLAGDSPSIRDKVIEEGGVDAVINFINNTTNRTNLIQAAWALSNLCRGQPLPEYHKIQKAVPVICKIISLRILDDQNLSDCLWALSYSIEGPKEKLNYFLQSNAMKEVIEYSQRSNLSISSPALRILGSVSTGNQSQTQQMLDAGILDVFEALIDSQKSLVRREVCWIISNISAGTRSQVDLLLSKEKMIDKILTLFELDSAQVKRQICYIFANMVFLGDRKKVKNLYLQKQVLRFYGDCIIQRNNLKLIQTALDTLPMIFDFGDKMKGKDSSENFAINLFLSYPGVTQSFQQLSQIESQKIYQKATLVYNRFFDTQDENKSNGMVIQN